MPTRNLFKYIFSVISVALFIGLFIWLLVSVFLPVILPSLLGSIRPDTEMQGQIRGEIELRDSDEDVVEVDKNISDNETSQDSVTNPLLPQSETDSSEKKDEKNSEFQRGKYEDFRDAYNI